MRKKTLGAILGEYGVIGVAFGEFDAKNSQAIIASKKVHFNYA